MDESTQSLASYADALRFDDLPADVIHHAKVRLIDALGCAMGGFHTELGALARSMAPTWTGQPAAHVLGSQVPTTPQMAAFANGAMLHALDFADVYMAQSTCHPSDTVAGVLAMADALGASGKATLLATVLAYEGACNFADVLPREQGLDNTFYCLVGAALGAAKLLGSTRAQIEHTIALAIVANVSLEQTRTGALSLWKSAAGPNAARNAVFAAEAARAGMTGPDAPIEGKWGLWHNVGVRFAWAPFGGQGGPFRIALAHLKRYPAVAHAQSPITAALQLRGRVRPEAIESIVIESYWVARRFDDPRSPLWNPQNHETAGGSLPFVVATALLDGAVTEASFAHDRLHAPAVRALMARTTVRETAAFNAIFPQEWPCRITVRHEDGTSAVVETRYFEGHNKAPMSDAAVEAKFRELAAPVLPAANVDAVLRGLRRLEAVDDVRPILAQLRVG